MLVKDLVAYLKEQDQEAEIIGFRSGEKDGETTVIEIGKYVHFSYYKEGVYLTSLENLRS